MWALFLLKLNERKTEKTECALSKFCSSSSLAKSGNLIWGNYFSGKLQRGKI
jgi:hypothetical protein